MQAADYNIVGHSGAGPEHVFVPFGKPPSSAQDRARVIQDIFTATNCPSGDHTLAGAEVAIERVLEAEADDYFVFLLSDANLGQYGVSPRALSQALTVNPKVHSYAIFISNDAAAEEMRRNMPVGRGHIVTDTSRLPQLFKEFFTTAVVSSNL